MADFWHLCHGEQILEGGQEQLESLLIERIESTGGVYEKKKKVRRLGAKKKDSGEIQLIGGDVVGADYHACQRRARTSIGRQVVRSGTLVHWSRGALQTNRQPKKRHSSDGKAVMPRQRHRISSMDSIG